MLKAIQRFITGEEGQGMAEYGLILALVAVAVIAALTAVGGGISTNFQTIADTL